MNQEESKDPDEEYSTDSFELYNLQNSPKWRSGLSSDDEFLQRCMDAPRPYLGNSLLEGE